MVTCYITKSASIPVAPGLVFGHDLSWYESGRDVHAYCTDSPVTNMRFAVWVPVLVAALWLIMFCRGDEPADRATSSAGAAVVSAQSPYRGSGSCSATACHGNITPLPPKISRVWRSEHTTWISSDAHSRAYQVLFDKRSKQIALNLADGSGREDAGLRGYSLPSVPYHAAPIILDDRDCLDECRRCGLRVLSRTFCPVDWFPHDGGLDRVESASKGRSGFQGGQELGASGRRSAPTATSADGPATAWWTGM